jgi:hypothetical protein
MRSLLRGHARLLLTTVMVGGAGAGVNAAHAQTETKPDLTIRLTSEARYDSNLARVAPGQLSVRGLEREDQSIRPGVGVTLVRPIGPVVATVDAGISYTFYRRNTVLNRERADISGNLAGPVGPCRVQVNAAYGRRQSDLGEVFLLNGGGRASVRNLETRQTYGGDILCGRQPGLRAGGGAEYEIANNDSAARSFSDNRRLRYFGNLAYATPTLGEITLTGGSEEVRYPQRASVPGSSSRYVSRSVGVRFQRDIGQALRGNISIGYTDLDPKNPLVARFRGVTWGADLTLSLGERFQARIGTSRAVQPAFQNEAVYSVQRQYSIDASYYLTDRVSVGGAATLYTRRYGGATAVLGELLTSDRRDSLRGSVTFRQSARIQFSLDGNYDRRDANGRLYDYNSAGAAFRVTVTL